MDMLTGTWDIVAQVAGRGHWEWDVFGCCSSHCFGSFLFKQGGFIGAWKKRYFILTSDQLLTYYKTNQAKEYAVGQFSVQGAHVQRESTRANAFSIQLAAPSHPDQPGRKYMLYAEQPADVDSWFKVLPVSAAAAAAAASAASPKSDKSAGDSKSKGGKSDGKESDGKSNGKGEAKSRRATTLLRTYGEWTRQLFPSCSSFDCV